ncbi:MAG: hypothetical protein JJU33_12055 [Phycisphaerales bacterium]|nr:hypothetical protein [Phycisphaerales bacterium]
MGGDKRWSGETRGGAGRIALIAVGVAGMLLGGLVLVDRVRRPGAGGVGAEQVLGEAVGARSVLAGGIDLAGARALEPGGRAWDEFVSTLGLVRSMMREHFDEQRPGMVTHRVFLPRAGDEAACSWSAARRGRYFQNEAEHQASRETTFGVLGAVRSERYLWERLIALKSMPERGALVRPWWMKAGMGRLGPDEERHMATVMNADAGELLAAAIMVEALVEGDVERAAEAAAIGAAIIETLIAQPDPGLSLFGWRLAGRRGRMLLDLVSEGVLGGEAAAGLLDAIGPGPDWARERRASVHRVSTANLALVLFSYSREDGRWSAELASAFWDPAAASRGVTTASRSVLPEATSPGLLARHANAEQAAEAHLQMTRAIADRSMAALFERPAQPALDSGRGGPVLPDRLGESLITSVDAVLEAMDRAEFFDASARTVLALEAYRSAHGDPPESLDELSPGLLERTPIDPWSPDGRFGYRRDSSSSVGYVLWSRVAKRGGPPCSDGPWEGAPDGAEGLVIVPRASR